MACRPSRALLIRISTTPSACAPAGSENVNTILWLAPLPNPGVVPPAAGAAAPVLSTMVAVPVLLGFAALVAITVMVCCDATEAGVV